MKVDTRLKIINVNCYSGYKANERPISFIIHGRQLLVKEIIDRWYGIGYSYFKILASDEKTYLIKFDVEKEVWTLEKILMG